MRFFCVVFLVFAIAFSGYAQQSEEWYQGKPIKDIVFEGLEHVALSELEGITEPYIGTAFSDDIYWDVLGKLYALEYFDNITPTAIPADPLRSEVTIRFTVTEKPIVSRINLIGNAGLKRNELLDVITLKLNDVVTQIKLRLDEQALVNKYLEKGYPDVKVRTETQITAKGTMIVNFIIDEGEKIAIEEFRFEGNTVFSDKTLKRQFSLNEKGIIKDGAYQEAKLVADRAALTQYYRDRGYIDAVLTDVGRDLRKDEKGNNLLTLTFRIYEGRQYTFGGVSFEGNRIFSTEQLSALIYSKVGETANDQRIQGDLMRVSDLYYENGYIFNRIEPVPQKDEDAGVVSYHILIMERGRAHIENIIIRGNKKTRDSVILREIPLEPGDVFSKTKVMDGLRNLYNLQYFSMVTPDTPPGSTESLMDLVVNVEEQPTTDVQFGLTFSGTADPDTFPISGMIKWNDRNVKGTGNIVGAELNASPDTQSATLEYTHRWIFGLPLSGSFDLTAQHAKRKGLMDNAPPIFYGDENFAFPDGFISYEEYDNADDKLPSDEFLMPYTQWRVSLGISSGYRFSTLLGNLSIGGGIRLGMIYSEFDENLYRPFDPVLREENHRWTPQTSIWTSVQLDQRDIYYDPSRGYYGIQRIGYYGLFNPEQEHYVRTDTKAEWFFTLFNIPVTDNYNFKAVFGIHSGISFIFRQPFFDAPRIEKANKLAVDGMFVGRGWSSDYSYKGYTLWENWAEIRIPLAPGILAWDFFFDAATINPEANGYFFEDFSFNYFRYSIGGGLRFTIPQFPFRFSLAKRFRIIDGQFQWMPGALGGSADNPASGIDFVISFAMSTY
jgi:outer membrane protein insertion porin family